jgi:UDP-N-acetylglucosamine 2-epimerase (non-hydrolysing)
MKAAPLFHALSEHPSVKQAIIHTGQHYDAAMSDVFFAELGLPQPDINLQVGSGSHAQQTAEIMARFEPAVLEQRPDCVLVYGDVNSTVAAALVCSKLGIRVAHVEAGLRSYDRTMPEEINRLVTDQLSDLLFTPSEDGNRNLAKEGIDPEKVHFVGNVMIDTLLRLLPRAMRAVPAGMPDRFALVTLHRPSNVDALDWLAAMLQSLAAISQEVPVIFPIHPRTRARMHSAGISVNGQIRLLDPLPYLAFLGMQQKAALVITDSGGIQEETTFLQVPCLTVRENTERPITITLGTNQLVGRDVETITKAAQKILSGDTKCGTIPPLWDGHAANRIAAILFNTFAEERLQAEFIAAT